MAISGITTGIPALDRMLFGDEYYERDLAF
jgi:hypothetical protein